MKKTLIVMNVIVYIMVIVYAIYSYLRTPNPGPEEEPFRNTPEPTIQYPNDNKDDYLTGAVEFIARVEGFSPRWYPDAGGQSIGYGFYSKGEGKIFLGRAFISKPEADRVLRSILTRMTTELNLDQYTVSGPEKIALLSFAYNVGIPAAKGSKLFKLLRERAPKYKVKREFFRWVYSRGKVIPALAQRRASEANLFDS